MMLGRAGAAASGGVTTLVNGKYVIERRLGGGGMAEVFLARTVGAEGFSRQVAIKRVLPGFSDNPQFAELFIAEAQLTSQLQHANLVSVFDFDRDREGRLFLVMELVAGADLDGLIETGPLPWSLVIFLAIEILRGLDYAHELPSAIGGMRGIVHRDISPHNVLLSWDGSVKLSDFGIAKARATTSATASVLIKGKPAFMSPEQARGYPLDGRSDLFSVGVMLFEMLCGKPLFAGNTTEETLARLLFDPIPRPRDLRPELPDDLSSVVVSLLQRDRDQRIPTASAAIAALVACADYPRNGREELVTTLAQRFAGRAPVRSRDVSHASPSDPTLIVRPAAPATPPGPVWRTATAAPTPAPFSFLRLVSGRAEVRRRWLGAIFAGVVLGGAVAMVALVKLRAGEAVPAVPALPPVPVVLPEPSPATGVTRPGSMPAASVDEPGPPPAPGARGSASSPSGVPSAVTSPERAPASRVPGRPAESPAPRPGGILEIHL